MRVACWVQDNAVGSAVDLLLDFDRRPLHIPAGKEDFVHLPLPYQ